MTATYEKIATTTLGSNTASTTFSSISGAYTDLVLISFVRDTRTNDLIILYMNIIIAYSLYS